MSETNKNVVITKTARAKLVRARAGDITLPIITKMAFGDGGVNAQGEVIAPSENQLALTHEIFRKNVSGHTFLEDATVRYVCTLDFNECVGKEISEVALVDADGDVVAIKTFTRKGKDDDVEQTYKMDDIF